MNERKFYIMIIGVFFGVLLIMQTKSFEGVTDLLLRDTDSNIFQEIQVLKDKNEDLFAETEELEEYLDQLDNQDGALGAIEDEINNYKLLSGKFSVFGPGLKVVLHGDITTPWMIDLVNELFTAGAQAVSVNGIRLVNHTAGFDTLPQGQILLNGSILSTPYQVEAIGESVTLLDVMELPGGLFDRIEATFSELAIQTEELDVIQML